MKDGAQREEALNSARRVAEQLRLPLGARAWRGQAGDFRGAGVGSSIDFQDHRDYAPGDDPRHINWQAFARTGQYTMKLYREEVRPLVDLLVDVSASMWAEEEKGRRTAELVYFFVLSAARSGASLRVHLVGDNEVRPVSQEAVLGHRWLDEVGELSGSGEGLALRRAALRPNAIRVLLSDLLFEGEPGGFLGSLHERQGTGLVFAPFTAQEAGPDWQGQYDFIDAELGTRHPHQIGGATLTRYLEAYRRHFAMWEEEGRRHQILLSRVSCSGSLMESLDREAVRLGALEMMP